MLYYKSHHRYYSKGIGNISHVPIAAVLLCRNNQCCALGIDGVGRKALTFVVRRENSSCKHGLFRMFAPFPNPFTLISMPLISLTF